MPSTTTGPRRSPLRLAAALVCAGALSLTLAACGGSGEDAGEPAVVVSTPASDSPYKGTSLGAPYDKPDVVLTDTDGEKYDLLKETAGRPTLLYFGYTHCPDVCPTTMGDIAIAKEKLSAKEQKELRVVFVTTDPERDTPEELRSWLDAFDSSFVGLTGSFDDIQKAARAVGVSVDAPEKEKDGTVTVDHGAQVLAYSPKDDKAHVIYTSGTTPEDFTHDLPLLLEGTEA
ncbi:SCO family protein [Streptomyces sp. NPDC059506]|uniref:SCO family protein n=1 Tax=Streptomyces TaxID=1883 RepID=UPI000CAEE7A8|nr:MULTISPECIES: SCO family protein [unclassified Streptomyces]MCZ2525089.1 SCO family protein [Streptomyces sp. HB2AG]PLW71280.1 hypothetical protein C0036_18665 [Streptomyces sp. DJ]QMV22570.1 redoxin domain-containing protein [Streptomyces sp. SCUT-3]